MGFTINATDDYMVAPMITRDALFKPAPSKPPGEGLEMVWYNGAGVYLNVLDPDGEVLAGAGMPQGGEGSYGFHTVNATRIVDPNGIAYPNERPILETLPTDEDNYSVVWSIVEASGGDGYRQGRFRTREQLDERRWSFNEAGMMILAGFVAGPINVPAWKPDRFTFTVGPVLDESGKAIKGVDVRISRGVEVVQGRTDAEGKVSFEVNSTWNDETVQTFLSKTGFFNSNFAAEIREYEHYIPLGGYVPPMVRVDDGDGLEGATTLALVGVLVIVLIVIAILIKGRGAKDASISEEEADEIFSDGKEDGVDEEDPHTDPDVKEIENDPQRST